MRAYEDIVEQGGRVADTMRAFKTFLFNTDVMAYLAMMAPRLVELKRVLKPTGSIYLHCDPTASHYLKILMDAVFGPQMFKNEVIWKRTSAHSAAKRWGDIHDTILYYTRGPEFIWSEVLIPHTDEYSARYKNIDESGKAWADDNLTASGVRHGDSGSVWRGFDVTSKGLHWKVNTKTVEKLAGREEAAQMTTTQKLDLLDSSGYIHWPRGGKGFPRFKRYLSEGSRIQDIVMDIPPINSQAQERLGYPTQKPEALLERIIKASSNEGDLVLDPFCGCGTTVQVAQRLNRRWIGIDITHLAIGLIKKRLSDAFGPEIKKTYDVIGEPTDYAGAAQLAEEDKYQFQWWALGQVGARPTEQKKGADRGIDGRLYFHDDESGKSKQIIFSVKGGHVTAAQVRDLAGVLSREKAEIGAFITFDEPTKPMTKEAADAGLYRSGPLDGATYPRLQILTIQQILDGKQPEYPARRDATFKKAPRSRPAPAENLTLPLKPGKD